MYTRTTAIILVVCLFVILSGAVYAQPGITNSGFESDVWNAEDPNGYRTTITGWTKTGGASWGLNQRGGPLAGTTGDTPEGGNFLFIQGSAANDVSQSLSGWQEGYRYDLTFHVNVREGAPGMNLEVLVGNKSIYGPVTHYYRQGWRQVVIPFRYQAAVMGGTDIKFRTSWTGADTTILIDRVRLTYARVVDFQTVMTNFESRLNLASYNTWGSTIWPTIVDGTKGYAQLGPGFMWSDHIANGIVDNVHLALLEPIVNDDPCARSLLGNTKMDDIQRAFMLNRNFVMTREFTFQVQLTNWSRATAVITDPVNCTLNNRPVWTNLATFTTGTQGHIDVSVDTGMFVVGTTTIGADFDLPSLWGPDTLLGGLSAGFDQDLADLLAAYLTIGDQNKVDYMQHIIASVMINGFRQNLDKFILDLLASGLKSDVGSGESYVADAGGEEKNYTPPALADQTFNVVPPDPKPTIEIEGTGTVTIL